MGPCSAPPPRGRFYRAAWGSAAGGTADAGGPGRNQSWMHRGEPRGRGFAPGPGSCHRPLLGAAPGLPVLPAPRREQLRVPSVAAGLCQAPAVLSAAPVPSPHGPELQPLPLPQPRVRKPQPCFTLAAQLSMIAASAPNLKLTVSNLQPCTQCLRPVPCACGPAPRVCSPCWLFFAHIFPLHTLWAVLRTPSGAAPASLLLTALLAADADGGSAQCGGEIHPLPTSGGHRANPDHTSGRSWRKGGLRYGSRRHC